MPSTEQTVARTRVGAEVELARRHAGHDKAGQARTVGDMVGRRAIDEQLAGDLPELPRPRVAQGQQPARPLGELFPAALEGLNLERFGGAARSTRS